MSPVRPGRIVAFVAVTIVCIAGAITYAVRGGSGTSTVAADGSGTTLPPAAIAEVLAVPHLLFRDTLNGPDFGHVAISPLADPAGPRAVTPLSCERVDFEVDRGVCLRADRGAVTTYATVVFDGSFHEVATFPLTGLPSRVRVSPDGHYGATTTFVSGDSYAAINFSTRTHLIDLRANHEIGDVETFHVIKDGQPLTAVDFNFWGVTFAQDPNTFYATLGTGGHTYLVRGDLGARQVTVLRDGVECPDLSPDNTKIAFKKRVPSAFGRVEWRLSVLDVATLQDHPLAETRNVDDQANWLDDQHVTYALPEADTGTPTTDTFSVPADGSGQPSIVIPGAYSTATVTRTG